MPATIAQHGSAVNGHALADDAPVGGAALVIRFRSLGDAQARLQSPGYDAIKDIRHGTVETRQLLGEGWPAD